MSTRPTSVMDAKIVEKIKEYVFDSDKHFDDASTKCSHSVREQCYLYALSAIKSLKGYVIAVTNVVTEPYNPDELLNDCEKCSKNTGFGEFKRIYSELLKYKTLSADPNTDFLTYNEEQAQKNASRIREFTYTKLKSELKPKLNKEEWNSIFGDDTVDLVQHLRPDFRKTTPPKRY